MASRLKKGDNVILISGSEKGKSGKIQTINRVTSKVTVQGLNMKKRHTKPDGKNPGGIISKEAPLDWSKIALMDKNGKPTRISIKKSEKDGKKVLERIAKTTGEAIA